MPLTRDAKLSGRGKTRRQRHPSPAGLPEWQLDDLYPGMGSDELRADLVRAAQDAGTFEARYKGQIGTLAAGKESGRALGEAVSSFEVISEILDRIASYAGLLYASDTSNPEYAKFFGDMQDRLTSISLHLVFFTLELNRIDEGLIEKALGDPSFGRYHAWVADIRRDKPHQLEDRVEQLFNEKAVTGAVSWTRLFDGTLAALRFDVDGEEMALEQTLGRLQEADESRRYSAASALTATLKANLRVFTLIMNTLAKDKEIADRWRGFADVAAARHLSNRVEGAVVEALAEAVRAEFPRLSHRYYALKARWLGKDALDHWDRNAPLPGNQPAAIAWVEARDTVLAAYSEFSPVLADIGRRFFENPWIDAPVRAGKAPGAFSHPTVPSAHPYILLNYQGKLRDVMTLAHELGHGIHQVLAAPRGGLLASTPLTLAETASVFGEMLTFRWLLDQRGKADRKAILAAKVEDMLNTVVRQIALYSFERQIHEERRRGELTADRISEFWLAAQRESLGPAVRLGPGYEVFWAYIPHFIHSPFYVYAYAFGDCLVNSLYSVYRERPQGFAKSYADLLAAGGSKNYRQLLEPFGLDPGDPTFWRKGLDVIGGLIDELEAIDRSGGGRRSSSAARKRRLS